MVGTIMRRPQFRLSTLLWIMLAVACWFGGIGYGRLLEQRALEGRLLKWRQQARERSDFYIGHGPLPDDAAN
jgi:hypothetical protein